MGRGWLAGKVGGGQEIVFGVGLGGRRGGRGRGRAIKSGSMMVVELSTFKREQRLLYHVWTGKRSRNATPQINPYSFKSNKLNLNLQKVIN
jgi:hypothetical protein